MPKITTLVVAIATVAAIMIWSRSPSVNGSPDIRLISPHELHTLAHLESLPIQHFEDHSLIYPTLARD
jgi:hypothetical protein